MRKEERIKMVKAMEFIARQINDETIFESWLMCGIADEDIEYGDLTTEEIDEYYIGNVNFSYLMDLFLRLMDRANRSGGLYCDGVVSTEREV